MRAEVIKMATNIGQAPLNPPIRTYRVLIGGIPRRWRETNVHQSSGVTGHIGQVVDQFVGLDADVRRHPRELRIQTPIQERAEQAANLYQDTRSPGRRSPR